MSYHEAVRSHLGRRYGLASAALVLSPSLLSEGVAAAGEDELVLALEPAYAVLTRDGSTHGGGAEASVWIGLTEALWLTASGGILGFDRGQDLPDLLYEGAGGIVAALDVLRTIPFVEAAVAALASEDAIVPSVRVGLGADYLVSPALSIGAVIRYRPLADELRSDSLFTLHLRVSWRLET